MLEVNHSLVKSLRKKHRLTLQEMADLLGFSNIFSYRRREIGESDFKPGHILQLSELFGVSVESFFLEN